MLEVGSVVAGYRVERILGSGGMGSVYVVANPELPRQDALKVLSGELSRDRNFRARFTREADVASRLDHPNIVSIYRRGETADGQLWIAMQFVDGVDADEALRRGEMSPQRAVYIVGEVGKALDYAHRQGVIHRDVKPANVLLSGEVGPDERVLLGDFGIARALDDVSVTGTGELVATLSYAAPEVIAGGQVDGRADLYSLGCTLFRLLTGKAPYEGAGSQAAVMMAHLQQPPPRVTAAAPWLPPALDAVLATALAKDPGQRFGSGVQLAAAAAAALRGGGPVPTFPPAGAQPTQQSGLSDRKPWQRTGPSAPDPVTPPPYVPVSATHFQPVSPSSGPLPQAYPPAPAPPSGGRQRIAVVAAVIGVVVVAAAAITTVMLTRGSDSDTSAEETTSAPVTTTAPLEPVPASELSNLMASPAAVAKAIGAPPLTMVKDNSQMWSGTIIDDDCSSIAVTNEQNSYSGSGYTAVHWQNLEDNPDGQSQFRVGQVVVSFADAEVATEYYDRSKGVWGKCANRTVNQRTAGQNDDPDDFWAVGAVSDNDGILSATLTEEGGEGWACQQGVSARNNIIIRVYVCGHADQSVVPPFIEAIAKKVDSYK